MAVVVIIISKNHNNSSQSVIELSKCSSYLTFELWQEHLGIISGLGFPPPRRLPPQIRFLQFLSVFYDVSILIILPQVNHVEILSMEA